MEGAIVIGWPEGYDDPEAQEIIALSRDDLKISSFRTKTEGLYAMVEWSVPTTFIIMLSGLFFKSFLEEAGKDSYQMLKTLLKQYILKRREIKSKLIAATTSPDKLSPNYDQSLSISLKARLHSGLLVTVLVSEKVEGEDVDDMLEGMFHVLELLYEDCHEKAPETSINKKARPEEIYLLANPEKKTWDIMTSKQLMEKYKAVNDTN